MKSIVKFLKENIFVTILVTVYFILVELLIYFERGHEHLGNHIDTQWEGLWYTTVTIAAVGYGDYVPYTTGGKVIGYIFVLASIFLYGFFISKLTNYIRVKNENRKMGYSGTKFKNHTVIIGWDHYAKLVADQLVSVGQRIAVVTDKRDDIELITEHYAKYAKNVYILYSELDNFDLIKKTNIEASKVVFVNVHGDSEKLVYILNMKKEYPHLKYIVNMDNADLKETFKTAGVTYPLSKHDLASKLMASYIFEPDVATLGEELMTVADNDFDHDIKQYEVIESNKYVNKMYNDAFFDIKKNYNSILLGISKKLKNGEYKLYKNPAEDVKIEKGDYILVITNGLQESKLFDAFGVEEGVR